MGRIHSVQSLGAVDGPGLRYVVFLQGCPLRCVYCHNPDTWNAQGGREMTPEELVEQILRYRPYFGDKGGVTLTGGEPLFQPEFTAEVFERLQKEGIHTALDTSGHGSDQALEQVLPVTDLALCDIKFLSEEGYRTHTGGSFGRVAHFLEQAKKHGVAVWLRHVVVPGLTDNPEGIQALCRLAEETPQIQKIQLLPFRKLCIEKYKELGIPFPLENTPACPEQTITRLQQLIPAVYR